MCASESILKEYTEILTMSRTIRNEKTKGFLDHLEHERRERKQARQLKADPLVYLDLNDLEIVF